MKYLRSSKTENKKRHYYPAREKGPAAFPEREPSWSIKGKMDGRTFGVQSLR
jgi:hypothetical protein